MATGTVRTTHIFSKALNFRVKPRRLSRGIEEYKFQAISGRFFKLIHSSASVGAKRPFLLVNRATSVKAVSKLLAACKEELISIGFAISDALENEKIYVIGKLTGEYEPSDLKKQFVDNGIDVTYISCEQFNFLTDNEKDSLNNLGIHIAQIDKNLSGQQLTKCLKDIFSGRGNPLVTVFA